MPQVVGIISNRPLHKLGWSLPLKFTADAEVDYDLAGLKKWK